MAAQGQVMVLFLLILAGYIIKKLNVITDNINKELTNLILYVTLPSFLLTAMNFDFSPEVLVKSGKLVAISLSIYAFTTLLSYGVAKVFKIKGNTKDILQFIIVFSNVGFMGYPVAQAVFGEVGTFYAAIYNLPFNILIWTLGVYFMTRKHEEEYSISDIESSPQIGETKFSWKVFVNPAIVAVISGFIMFVFSIKLPAPIFNTLKLIGDTTTPLAMMFIGTTLADVDYKDIFVDKRAFLFSIIRLLIIPVMAMLVLQFLGFKDYLVGIPVIILAMPAPAMVTILATKYNNDYHLASKTVFLSTLFSILTIPLVLILLG